MKKFIFSLIFSIFTLFSIAQKIDSTALILIDIQDFYFPGGAAELVEPEKAAKQAKIVLEQFRKNNGLVVHVKHKVKAGGDIHDLVAPIAGEKVVSKSEVSCFNGTGLENFLKSEGIKYVVLIGMQTHMCLEGGTRAAFDLGYKCAVIGVAFATRYFKFGVRTLKA
ncbi:MAG: isochorismatase family protein, partial [Draconibacterium sp.]|nr:isochorismatase family protein [Draconibacterium sp.]